MRYRRTLGQRLTTAASQLVAVVAVCACHRASPVPSLFPAGFLPPLVVFVAAAVVQFLRRAETASVRRSVSLANGLILLQTRSWYNAIVLPITLLYADDKVATYAHYASTFSNNIYNIFV